MSDEPLTDHPIVEPPDSPQPAGYIADPGERLDWMLAHTPDYVRRVT